MTIYLSPDGTAPAASPTVGARIEATPLPR
jgi:hypothetical protein